MRQAAVRLATALLCLLPVPGRPAPSPDGQALTPFEASYTWIWHGAVVAVSNLVLARREGDVWDYSSSSEPRGLGNLYPQRPRMQSVLRVSDEGVQPLHYQASDGTAANERGADVAFDWDSGHASGNYQGVKVDLALKSGVQDDMSMQIALLVALRLGREPEHLSMIDKNSIRDYSYRREGTQTIDTRLGRIDTVIYASHHAGSPRVTRFWCAPSRGYVPLRVQQKRLDSVEWTMEIQTLQDGPASR